MKDPNNLIHSALMLKSKTDIILINFDDLENRESDSIKIAMAKYQTQFKYLFDRYCAMNNDKNSI